MPEVQYVSNPPRRGHHYPTTLIDVWRSGDGERFVLRPILPQDLPLLEDMIRRSSPATRYDRFHGAVNGLPLDVLRDMTHVDYEKHLALVITWTGTCGEILVADARYSVDADGQSAEVALLVEDRWQRRGLGQYAVQSLVNAARRAGLIRLRGNVLRRNATMLSLMRRCGFRPASGAEEARAISVEKRLDELTVPSSDVGLDPIHLAAW
ncbi:GNAT family N-acetyltransferase [Piscinibacter sp.]|jgi:GNAT superfamily N-acetyltransferase|uniref:GNAT family N-acetyltransferase n=1 Tax=Piscinibacter sp. TaxID=1903157 RepID=UPI003559E5EF